MAWGLSTAEADSTVGLVGEFYAEDLEESGFVYWQITTASITFGSDGCIGDDTTVEFHYTDNSGTVIVNLYDITVTTSDDTYTFEAELVS